MTSTTGRGEAGRRFSPQTRTILANTGWLIGERAVRGVVALTVTVAVARYLGPRDFGILSFALAFVLLFSPLQALGLAGVVVRELVRRPSDHSEILGSVFVLRLGGALMTVVAVLGAAVAINVQGSETRIALVVLSAAMVFNAFEVVEQWLQSEVRSRYAVAARGVALLTSAIASVGLILMGAPLLAFAVAIALEYILGGIGFAIAYELLGRSLRLWRPTVACATSMLRMSWPLILSGAFAAVNMRIDQVMLGSLLGTEAVGTYAAAARISEVWYFIPAAFAVSLFPSLIEARHRGSSRYESQLQRAYDLMVWGAVPLALVVALLSGHLVRFLFGSDFGDAAPILSIHIWASPLMFAGPILSRWLIIEDLLKFSMIRHGAGALVNVALNLALIPRFGGAGAAAATVVSYAVATYFACWLYGPARPAARQMSLALIAPLRLLRSTTA